MGCGTSKVSPLPVSGQAQHHVRQRRKRQDVSSVQGSIHKHKSGHLAALRSNLAGLKECIELHGAPRDRHGDANGFYVYSGREVCGQPSFTKVLHADGTPCSWNADNPGGSPLQVYYAYLALGTHEDEFFDNSTRPPSHSMTCMGKIFISGGSVDAAVALIGSPEDAWPTHWQWVGTVLVGFLLTATQLQNTKHRTHWDILRMRHRMVPRTYPSRHRFFRLT